MIEMQYPTKGLTRMRWGSFSATVNSTDEKAWHIVVKEDDKVVWEGLKYITAEEIPALIEEKIRAPHRKYERPLVEDREHLLTSFFVFERPAN